MFYRPLAVVFVGLLTVAVRADDPAVKLTVYTPKTGDRFRTEKVHESDTTMTFTLMGATKTDPKRETKTVVYDTEILDAGDPKAKWPKKFTRTYTKAVEKTDDAETNLPYAGMTVLFENRGGKFRFTTGGEELADDEADDFKKEFDKDKSTLPENQDFLPDGPIKPGDSWTSDPHTVLKATDQLGPFGVDKKATKLDGKFVRGYARDGRQFGVLRLDQTIVIGSMTIQDNRLDAAEGSKVTVAVDVDGCIDGSRPDEKSTVATTIDLTFSLPNGTIKLAGKDATTESITPLPKSK